jgi:hypothetical protein
MELEKFCREKGIDIICKNRVVEGNFINDSLFEVRNTIKTILYQKNKGKKRAIWMATRIAKWQAAWEDPCYKIGV